MPRPNTVESTQTSMSDMDQMSVHVRRAVGDDVYAVDRFVDVQHHEMSPSRAVNTLERQTNESITEKHQFSSANGVVDAMRLSYKWSALIRQFPVLKAVYNTRNCKTPTEALRVLIETSPVALTAVNSDDEVVAVMTCADVPSPELVATNGTVSENNDTKLSLNEREFGFHSFWNAIPGLCPDLRELNMTNSLFVTCCIVFDEGGYASEATQTLFRTMFAAMPDVDYCLYGCIETKSTPTLIDYMEQVSVVSTLSPLLQENKVAQRMTTGQIMFFVSVRDQYLPTLSIRVAAVEDHDDVAPIFESQSEIVSNAFGEFFLADLIEHQDADNKAFVGTVDQNTAVGLLAVSSHVDTAALNTNFDLVAFNNLTKRTWAQERREMLHTLQSIRAQRDWIWVMQKHANEAQELFEAVARQYNKVVSKYPISAPNSPKPYQGQSSNTSVISDYASYPNGRGITRSTGTGIIRQHSSYTLGNNTGNNNKSHLKRVPSWQSTSTKLKTVSKLHTEIQSSPMNHTQDTMMQVPLLLLVRALDGCGRAWGYDSSNGVGLGSAMLQELIDLCLLPTVVVVMAENEGETKPTLQGQEGKDGEGKEEGKEEGNEQDQQQYVSTRLDLLSLDEQPKELYEQQKAHDIQSISYRLQQTHTLLERMFGMTDSSWSVFVVRDALNIALDRIAVAREQRCRRKRISEWIQLTRFSTDELNTLILSQFEAIQKSICTKRRELAEQAQAEAERILAEKQQQAQDQVDTDGIPGTKQSLFSDTFPSSIDGDHKKRIDGTTPQDIKNVAISSLSQEVGLADFVGMESTKVSHEQSHSESQVIDSNKSEASWVPDLTLTPEQVHVPLTLLAKHITTYLQKIGKPIYGGAIAGHGTNTGIASKSDLPSKPNLAYENLDEVGYSDTQWTTIPSIGEDLVKEMGATLGPHGWIGASLSQQIAQQLNIYTEQDKKNASMPANALNSLSLDATSLMEDDINSDNDSDATPPLHSSRPMHTSDVQTYQTSQMAHRITDNNNNGDDDDDHTSTRTNIKHVKEVPSLPESNDSNVGTKSRDISHSTTDTETKKEENKSLSTVQESTSNMQVPSTIHESTSNMEFQSVNGLDSKRSSLSDLHTEQTQQQQQQHHSHSHGNTLFDVIPDICFLPFGIPTAAEFNQKISVESSVIQNLLWLSYIAHSNGIDVSEHQRTYIVKSLLQADTQQMDQATIDARGNKLLEMVEMFGYPQANRLENVETDRDTIQMAWKAFLSSVRLHISAPSNASMNEYVQASALKHAHEVYSNKEGTNVDESGQASMTHHPTSATTARGHSEGTQRSNQTSAYHDDSNQTSIQQIGGLVSSASVRLAVCNLPFNLGKSVLNHPVQATFESQQTPSHTDTVPSNGATRSTGNSAQTTYGNSAQGGTETIEALFPQTFDFTIGSICAATVGVPILHVPSILRKSRALAELQATVHAMEEMEAFQKRQSETSKKSRRKSISNTSALPSTENTRRGSISSSSTKMKMAQAKAKLKAKKLQQQKEQGNTNQKTSSAGHSSVIEKDRNVYGVDPIGGATSKGSNLATGLFDADKDPYANEEEAGEANAAAVEAAAKRSAWIEEQRRWKETVVPTYSGVFAPLMELLQTDVCQLGYVVCGIPDFIGRVAPSTVQLAHQIGLKLPLDQLKDHSSFSMKDTNESAQTTTLFDAPEYHGLAELRASFLICAALILLKERKTNYMTPTLQAELSCFDFSPEGLIQVIEKTSMSNKYDITLRPGLHPACGILGSRNIIRVPIVSSKNASKHDHHHRYDSIQTLMHEYALNCSPEWCIDTSDDLNTKITTFKSKLKDIWDGVNVYQSGAEDIAYYSQKDIPAESNVASSITVGSKTSIVSINSQRIPVPLEYQPKLMKPSIEKLKMFLHGFDNKENVTDEKLAHATTSNDTTSTIQQKDTDGPTLRSDNVSMDQSTTVNNVAAQTGAENNDQSLLDDLTFDPELFLEEEQEKQREAALELSILPYTDYNTKDDPSSASMSTNVDPSSSMTTKAETSTSMTTKAEASSSTSVTTKAETSRPIADSMNSSSGQYNMIPMYTNWKLSIRLFPRLPIDLLTQTLSCMTSDISDIDVNMDHAMTELISLSDFLTTVLVQNGFMSTFRLAEADERRETLRQVQIRDETSLNNNSSISDLPQMKSNILNAFSISVFCIDPEFSARAKDFLPAAFAAFPDREYLILTQSHSARENSLLPYFIRVSPRPGSTYSQILYIAHRDSFLAHRELVLKPFILPNLEPSLPWKSTLQKSTKRQHENRTKNNKATISGETSSSDTTTTSSLSDTLSGSPYHPGLVSTYTPLECMIQEIQLDTFLRSSLHPYNISTVRNEIALNTFGLQNSLQAPIGSMFGVYCMEQLIGIVILSPSGVSFYEGNALCSSFDLERFIDIDAYKCHHNDGHGDLQQQKQQKQATYDRYSTLGGTQLDSNGIESKAIEATNVFLNAFNGPGSINTIAPAIQQQQTLQTEQMNSFSTWRTLQICEMHPYFSFPAVTQFVLRQAMLWTNTDILFYRQWGGQIAGTIPLCLRQLYTPSVQSSSSMLMEKEENDILQQSMTMMDLHDESNLSEASETIHQLPSKGHIQTLKNESMHSHTNKNESMHMSTHLNTTTTTTTATTTTTMKSQMHASGLSSSSKTKEYNKSSKEDPQNKNMLHRHTNENDTSRIHKNQTEFEGDEKMNQTSFMSEKNLSNSVDTQDVTMVDVSGNETSHVSKYAPRILPNVVSDWMIRVPPRFVRQLRPFERQLRRDRFHTIESQTGFSAMDLYGVYPSEEMELVLRDSEIRFGMNLNTKYFGTGSGNYQLVSLDHTQLEQHQALKHHLLEHQQEHQASYHQASYHQASKHTFDHQVSKHSFLSFEQDTTQNNEITDLIGNQITRIIYPTHTAENTNDSIQFVSHLMDMQPPNQTTNSPTVPILSQLDIFTKAFQLQHDKMYPMMYQNSVSDHSEVSDDGEKKMEKLSDQVIQIDETSHDQNIVANAVNTFVPGVENHASQTLQLSDPRLLHHAMYFTTRKLLSEPKLVINTRIVVVGASDTGLSILNTLLNVPYLRFTSLSLISPGGICPSIPPYAMHAPPTVSPEQTEQSLAVAERLVRHSLGQQYKYEQEERELRGIGAVDTDTLDEYAIQSEIQKDPLLEAADAADTGFDAVWEYSLPFSPTGMPLLPRIPYQRAASWIPQSGSFDALSKSRWAIASHTNIIDGSLIEMDRTKKVVSICGYPQYAMGGVEPPEYASTSYQSTRTTLADPQGTIGAIQTQGICCDPIERSQIVNIPYDVLILTPGLTEPTKDSLSQWKTNNGPLQFLSKKYKQTSNRTSSPSNHGTMKQTRSSLNSAKNEGSYQNNFGEIRSEKPSKGVDGYLTHEFEQSMLDTLGQNDTMRARAIGASCYTAYNTIPTGFHSLTDEAATHALERDISRLLYEVPDARHPLALACSYALQLEVRHTEGFNQDPASEMIVSTALQQQQDQQHETKHTMGNTPTLFNSSPTRATSTTPHHRSTMGGLGSPTNNANNSNVTTSGPQTYLSLLRETTLHANFHPQDTSCLKKSMRHRIPSPNVGIVGGRDICVWGDGLEAFSSLAALLERGIHPSRIVYIRRHQPLVALRALELNMLFGNDINVPIPYNSAVISRYFTQLANLDEQVEEKIHSSHTQKDNTPKDNTQDKNRIPWTKNTTERKDSTNPGTDNKTTTKADNDQTYETDRRNAIQAAERAETRVLRALDALGILQLVGWELNDCVSAAWAVNDHDFVQADYTIKATKQYLEANNSNTTGNVGQGTTAATTASNQLLWGQNAADSPEMKAVQVQQQARLERASAWGRLRAQQERERTLGKRYGQTNTILACFSRIKQDPALSSLVKPVTSDVYQNPSQGIGRHEESNKNLMGDKKASSKTTGSLTRPISKEEEKIVGHKNTHEWDDTNDDAPTHQTEFNIDDKESEHRRPNISTNVSQQRQHSGLDSHTTPAPAASTAPAGSTTAPPASTNSNRKTSFTSRTISSPISRVSTTATQRKRGKRREDDEMQQICLDCRIFIAGDLRDVDLRFFGAVNGSGLVYDGRLVVDHKFATVDPTVLAGGPVTQFSRRYRAPTTMECHNSVEVGATVARYILAQVDPITNAFIQSDEMETTTRSNTPNAEAIRMSTTRRRNSLSLSNPTDMNYDSTTTSNALAVGTGAAAALALRNAQQKNAAKVVDTNSAASKHIGSSVLPKLIQPRIVLFSLPGMIQSNQWMDARLVEQESAYQNAAIIDRLLDDDLGPLIMNPAPQDEAAEQELIQQEQDAIIAVSAPSNESSTTKMHGIDTTQPKDEQAIQIAIQEAKETATTNAKARASAKEQQRAMWQSMIQSFHVTTDTRHILPLNALIDPFHQFSSNRANTKVNSHESMNDMTEAAGTNLESIQSGQTETNTYRSGTIPSGDQFIYIRLPYFESGMNGRFIKTSCTTRSKLNSIDAYVARESSAIGDARIGWKLTHSMYPSYEKQSIKEEKPSINANTTTRKTMEPGKGGETTTNISATRAGDGEEPTNTSSTPQTGEAAAITQPTTTETTNVLPMETQVLLETLYSLSQSNRTIQVSLDQFGRIVSINSMTTSDQGLEALNMTRLVGKQAEYCSNFLNDYDMQRLEDITSVIRSDTLIPIYHDRFDALCHELRQIIGSNESFASAVRKIATAYMYRKPNTEISTMRQSMINTLLQYMTNKSHTKVSSDTESHTKQELISSETKETDETNETKLEIASSDIRTIHSDIQRLLHAFLRTNKHLLPHFCVKELFVDATGETMTPEMDRQIVENVQASSLMMANTGTNSCTI